MANVINFEDYPLFEKGCLTNFNDQYYYRHDLGQIDSSFPWTKLVNYFEKKFSQNKQKKGRRRLFSIRTELATIVLKGITGLSDKQIMERLAQDWVYQRFARVKILDFHQNFTILSDIRERYSKVTNIDELQDLFASHWSDYLSAVEGVLMDATVFKSNISYPNEIELLWESIQWLHKRIKVISRTLGQKTIRSKYKEIEKVYKRISTQKEPRYKEKKKLMRRELNLLSKYLEHFAYLVEQLPSGISSLYPSEQETYITIKKIYQQRRAKYEGKQVKNLILSLYKPYVHCIYRGKRSGRWEYGEKYHLFLLGGMVWIDYISNENFNECNRLESVVRKSEQYTGHFISYLGADRIYATRSNRAYLKSKAIKENFVPLGRPIQNKLLREQQRILKQALNAARNSKMEGIIGVLKVHYNTERVKVKAQKTERMIIFFSLMSHNAKEYSRSNTEKAQEQKQAG